MISVGDTSLASPIHLIQAGVSASQQPASQHQTSQSNSTRLYSTSPTNTHPPIHPSIRCSLGLYKSFLLLTPEVFVGNKKVMENCQALFFCSNLTLRRCLRRVMFNVYIYFPPPPHKPPFIQATLFRFILLLGWRWG